MKRIIFLALILTGVGCSDFVININFPDKEESNKSQIPLDPETGLPMSEPGATPAIHPVTGLPAGLPNLPPPDPFTLPPMSPLPPIPIVPKK